MKMLGLDIGGAWVGSAISDALGLICRPYKTVHIDDLVPFLRDLFKAEQISTVVVGHPVTVKGGKSQQTKEIEAVFDKLRAEFSQEDEKNIVWELWDERFSSQRASLVMGRSKKGGHKTGDKERREHSIAAAFILQSYIDSRALQQEQ